MSLLPILPTTTIANRQTSGGSRAYSVTLGGGCLVAFKLRETSECRAPGSDCRHESIYAAPPFSRSYGDESAAIFKSTFACMPRGNAYSRVNWMRQVRRWRSATKAQANSIAYKRFFGQPPIRDIKALRGGWFVTASASGLGRNISEVVLASKSHQYHSVSR